MMCLGRKRLSNDPVCTYENIVNKNNNLELFLGVTISYFLETIKTSKPTLVRKTIYDVLIGILYSSVIYR